MNKNAARIEILNYIICNCTMKHFGDRQFSLGDIENSFQGSHFNPKTPPIGALCMLSAAPNTKWYLAWLKDVKEESNRSLTKYLLESIEDGGECWWENVMIWHLPLETSNKHPQWKWTDEQFKLKNTWFHLCFKKRRADWLKPMMPIFQDNGTVVLRLRQKWTEGFFAEKEFESIKKVTQKSMLEFYDQSLIKSEEELKAKRDSSAAN